jgi:ribosomal protein S1
MINILTCNITSDDDYFKKVNNKFYTKAIQEFKHNLNCFSLFDNRVVEGIVLEYNNSHFIDIGFKYLIKMRKLHPLNNSIILKIIKLETLFNDLHVNYVSLKYDLNNKLNWFILKKAFENKCFLNGKILNPVRNGFSVGICGFVGFIPKKHCINYKYNVSSIYIITSFNLFKKTFSLSQKQINKIASRTLFKLSSKIIYISKN